LRGVYNILLKTSYNENCFRQSVDKIKRTHIFFYTFFQKSCHLWDNLRARQLTNDNVIWCLRFACWITKATCTHSEYEMLMAFPRQQLLCKYASVLCVCVWCVFCCMCLWPVAYCYVTVILYRVRQWNLTVLKEVVHSQFSWKNDCYFFNKYRRCCNLRITKEYFKKIVRHEK
jgi:hypothetical protein